MTLDIACPACAKRSESAENCPRCGCDLTMLRLTLAASARHLGQARRELQGGNWSGALEHAARSWGLWRNRPSAAVAFVAACALGDVPALSRWRARAEVQTEP